MRWYLKEVAESAALAPRMHAACHALRRDPQLCRRRVMGTLNPEPPHLKLVVYENTSGSQPSATSRL